MNAENDCGTPDLPHVLSTSAALLWCRFFQVLLTFYQKLHQPLKQGHNKQILVVPKPLQVYRHKAFSHECTLRTLLFRLLQLMQKTEAKFTTPQ